MREDEDAFGFWARADTAGPGVVMIPDVWGVSDLYRGLARRLAAEGLATLVEFARGGRRRAAGVMAVLALMLLWNRIPYPAATHRLLALSPREFVAPA